MRENNIVQAKKMYPIGTTFYSSKSGITFTVKTNAFIEENDGNIKLANGFGNVPYVYFNGKWAEIISLPEPKNEIIDNYEIY